MFITVVVDIAIAVILIIGAVLGIKRGFFLTVTKPVKWFAALALAFSLCNTVAADVVQPIIEEPITNQITEYLSEKCDDITSQTAKDELPTVLKIAAGIVGVDLNSFTGETSAEVIEQIVDKLAVPVIHLIAVLISFFAIYFISKILFAILIALLNDVFKSGIFGVFNKILGFVFGLAFAFILSWLLVVIFGYIISIPAVANAEWVKNFNGGFIYDFFKRMSPVDLLFSF